MAFSGFTTSTKEKLLLDAGAFFKDYDITKSYEENKTAGKLLGATQGGGSFSAVPTVRQINVDGVKGVTKGLEAIDEWVVTMTMTLLEAGAEATKLALGAADIEEVQLSEQAEANDYTKTTGRAYFNDSDYYTNVAWVGKISGSSEPVIIVVKNALSTGGLSLTFADKAEATTAITVTGHYTEEDLDTPPFEIYHPILAQ